MNLEPFYQKYGHDRVDQALKELSYHKISTQPKSGNEEPPIIYIFRHGQSEDNSNQIFSGWRDVGLTEKGKEQALTLARKLSQKKINLLISSTQSRAVETMKIALSLNVNAKNLPIIQDPRLRERSYGVLEGKSKLELYLNDKQLCQEYRRSYFKKAQNGESLEDVVRRVSDFINELIPEIKKRKINVAISCHGNSIRGFRKYFENLTPEETSKIETPLGEDYISYRVE